MKLEIIDIVENIQLTLAPEARVPLWQHSLIAGSGRFLSAFRRFPSAPPAASERFPRIHGTLRQKLAKKKEFLADSVRSFFRKVKLFFSNRQNRKLVLVIAARLVLTAILLEFIFQYNRFSSQYTIVNARRADIDQEIQRRANLMPNLRKLANKYVIHEQRLFKYTTDTSSLGVAASLQGSNFDMTNPFERTLSRMLFAWLMWPRLKATQSVQDLIKEAATTENMITEAKLEYNKACQTYNNYRLAFPGNFFGFIFGFDLIPYIGVGKDIMEVPCLRLKVPYLVSRPDGKIADATITVTDPISWLKAEFLKNQSNVPGGKPAEPAGVKE